MSDIKVTITAYEQGLKEGLKRAKSEVDKFTKETEGAFTGMGAKLTAIFSVGAIVGGIRALGEWAAGLKDTSEELGLTSQQVQRLNHAFAEGAASTDDFTKGMVKMTNGIADARNGNEQLLETFNRLGVTWDDLQNNTPYEILMKLADGAEKAEDKTQLLRDATELFGKSAYRLLPTLKAGSEAMTKLGNEAVVATDQAVESADRLQKKWDALLATLKSLAVNAATAFIEGNGNTSTPSGSAEGGSSVPGSPRYNPNAGGGFNPAAYIAQRKAEEAAKAQYGPPASAAAAPAGEQYGPPLPVAGRTRVDPRIAKDIEEQAKAVTEQLRKQREIDDAIADGELDRAQNLKDRLADEKKVTEELAKQAKQKAVQDYKDGRNSTPDQRRDALRARHKDARQDREFDDHARERERTKRANESQMHRENVKDARPGADGKDGKDGFKDVTSRLDKLIEKVGGLKDKLAVA